ncbi:MAG: peptide-methionine (R)-S-oxide reductase [Bacteroidetes bacterium]|nr:MAG: peptide-methionine (R)-S-oxide reductase [Bacteroidota bacterium]
MKRSSAPSCGHAGRTLCALRFNADTALHFLPGRRQVSHIPGAGNLFVNFDSVYSVNTCEMKIRPPVLHVHDEKQISMKKLAQIVLVFVILSTSACSPDASRSVNENKAANEIPKTTVAMKTDDTAKKIVKTDEEWKKILTPEQYRILRQKGTEYAFSGQYWNSEEKGIYRCAGCNNILFVSEQKFESGCGWPSFSMPFDSTTCDYHEDNTYGMTRTEVTCKACGGHLGHVFNDGPPPTGQRYCINSGSLKFEAVK